MQVLGDFTTADTLYVFFDTYDANGASVTISGLAISDIEIYKNGSVTQRASDNGYALLDTDGIDFDGAVGLHGLSVNFADNSDAGFFSNGAQYVLNVNAITVAGQTVRFSYQFTIGRLLKPTTAGQTLNLTAGDVTAGSLNAGARGDVALAVLGATALDWITAGTVGALLQDIFTNASEGAGDVGTLLTRLTLARAGYLDNLNVGGNVASAAVQTAIKAKTDNLPTDPASVTNQTLILNRLGAPAGASVSADIAAVKAKTDALPAFPANFALMLIDADGRAIVDAHKVKWAIAGATQTVYRADGSTPAYTKTLTTNAGAEPVVGNT